MWRKWLFWMCCVPPIQCQISIWKLWQTYWKRTLITILRLNTARVWITWLDSCWQFSSRKKLHSVLCKVSPISLRWLLSLTKTSPDSNFSSCRSIECWASLTKICTNILKKRVSHQATLPRLGLSLFSQIVLNRIRRTQSSMRTCCSYGTISWLLGGKLFSSLGYLYLWIKVIWCFRCRSRIFYIWFKTQQERFCHRLQSKQRCTRKWKYSSVQHRLLSI